MLTQSRLKELLHYDPETGVFTRLVGRTSAKAGDVAGSPNRFGYLRVKIDRKDYSAHRLAWLYVYGVWPSGVIDHLNGDSADNRIANLRDVPQATNSRNRHKQKNNTSGNVGVAWNRRKQKWCSYITVDYRRVHLGNYDSIEAARSARLAAEKEHWRCVS